MKERDAFNYTATASSSSHRSFIVFAQ